MTISKAVSTTTPDKPLVSIIIATYNSEPFIAGCLESIVGQVEKNIEIVIVDGESNDRTLEIIRSFNLPNLRLSSEKDKGIYDALNKGINIANGRFLYFLGSDDRLLPDFSKLTSKLRNDRTVYYGNSAPLDRLLSGKFSKYRLAKYCMNHQSIIYPAGVFEKYGYQLKYKVLADYVLNIQVWGDPYFIKKHHPLTIVHYNMDGFSSKNKDQAFRKDRKRLIRQNMGLLTYLRFLLKEYRSRKRPEVLEV